MGFFESDEEENQAQAQVAAEPELRDWRGKPIEVGTRIVYPGRRSSSIWVTEAEVVEIGEEIPGYSSVPVPFLKARQIRATSRWRVDQDAPKLVKLTELDRVTVVY